MKKDNKKYYILMLIMVIISISIPVCTNANEFSDAEWSSSVAAEQSKFQSSALAEQSRRQSEWDSSVAAEQSKQDKENEKAMAEASSNLESISSSLAQVRENQTNTREHLEKIWDALFGPLIVFIVIAAVIVYLLIIVKLIKGNRSAKKTFMPFQSVSSDNENHIPQNTLQKVEGKCMYCGKDISSDSEFCNHCGKKQVEEYVKVFNRYNMNNDEFIASINSWLASNPKIANVKCEFNMRTGYGFLVNKYLLDSVALKYELFKNNNENQYAIVELKKFGFYQKSSDALLEEWKANNPNAIVLKRSGGKHSRGKEGHELFLGIGAKNNTQLFIFFKFKRNQ